MADGDGRRIGIAVAIGAIGLALLGWWALRAAAPDGDGPAPDRRTVRAQSGPPPEIVGERAGRSHARAPVVDGADPGGAALRDGHDAGAVPAPSTTDGPVGELTAIDLETVALPAPPGDTSLVAPRFSPTGLRLVASTGKSVVRTLWVMDVDHTERGWTRVASPTGLAEPSWLDDDTLVAVREAALVRYRVGGEIEPVLQEVDEPGAVAQPAASPDASRVAWISIRPNNGGGDLRVLERATGVITDLTPTATREADPAWRPDGAAITGTAGGRVTVWDLASRSVLHEVPRPAPGRSPGFWGDGLQWQEGEGFVVDLVAAVPIGGPPRVIARRALPSVDRPAPVVAGFAWVSSLTDRGTVWAVRPDGSGVVVDTDAAFASQPDVVERADGIWLAFTSAESDTHVTRVHVGRLDAAALARAH